MRQPQPGHLVWRGGGDERRYWEPLVQGDGGDEEALCEWDELNHLVSYSIHHGPPHGPVTSSTTNATKGYLYRADGMRVEKDGADGAVTLYRLDGQMPVVDQKAAPDTGPATVTRYGLGARGVNLIELTNSSGTVTAFPLYDAHGDNVVSLTRSGAGFSIGDRRSYDAWGVVRAQQGGDDPKLRYCGS